MDMQFVFLDLPVVSGKVAESSTRTQVRLDCIVSISNAPLTAKHSLVELSTGRVVKVAMSVQAVSKLMTDAVLLATEPVPPPALKDEARAAISIDSERRRAARAAEVELMRQAQQ